jgi:hypothetical protein
MLSHLDKHAQSQDDNHKLQKKMLKAQAKAQKKQAKQ